MPMHVESSWVEGDNLRLSAASPPLACRRAGRRRPGPQPRNSLRVMMTMMLVMLAGLPECTAFRAYD
jgi:hypothetical protein